MQRKSKKISEIASMLIRAGENTESINGDCGLDINGLNIFIARKDDVK